MSFTTELIQSADDIVIHLKNLDNGICAEILGFGAMLNRWVFPNGSNTLNVIDGFNDTAHARATFTDGFKSVKLSPFVCRMRHGSFTYQDQSLKVNGPYLKGHAIHGLLCNALFQVAEYGADHEKAFVKLVHEYHGADQGYPFPYTISVVWTLSANNLLQVATTINHRHTKAIPLSDGWHPYFTTGTSVDKASLQFSGHQMLVFDDELIPTGEVVEDNRFVHGMRLKGIELDNCFVLDQESPKLCILEDDHIRIRIIPEDSYPYLQVYIPPHRNSIAIENLSSPPDSFNNGIGLCWLEPQTEKRFVTSYQVSLK
jgi:aldose 1-epimerase